MLEHPEVTWCLRTGYPSYNQPREVRCELCGDIIDDEIYEDDGFDCLCLDCLKTLHVKDRW